MLSTTLIPRSLGRALVSILLILHVNPDTCQSSTVESQPDGADGGQLQDSVLSYADRPTRLMEASGQLEELRPLAVEETLQTPQFSDKRFNKFVRVGRGSTGTFVRIGKSNDMNDETDGLLDELQSTFPDSIAYPKKRQMHRFIRIGRGMQEYDFDKEMLEGDADNTDTFDRYRKAPSSFVRIGKAPNKFVRIGKSPSSFVRIGKSPSRFLRIGKSPSSFVRIGKSPSSFVRIGKSPSSFVRIGKSLPDEPIIFNDKRPSSFVRIGRSAQQADEPQVNDGADIKRPSSFVRIGKPYSTLDSAAKRPSSFVRIGKSANETPIKDDSSLKRASAFVRIGKSTSSDQDNHLIDNIKRPSSFVRIGKSNAGTSDKRAGNFLRIGRLANPHADASKRGFVRIGRRDGKSANSKSRSPYHDSKPSSDESLSNEQPKGDAGPINLSNRGSAFVRIGKIPSSAFVRIGKNSDVMVQGEPARVYSFNRGSRGGHSSFVRIG